MSDFLACKEYFSQERLFLLSSALTFSDASLDFFSFLFVLHIGFAVTPCHGERQLCSLFLISFAGLSACNWTHAHD